jgi:hypothetical protein
MVELDASGRRLRAVLAAVLVRDRARELDLVHQWLDSWSGIGLVVVGMTHQGGRDDHVLDLPGQPSSRRQRRRDGRAGSRYTSPMPFSLTHDR